MMDAIDLSRHVAQLEAEIGRLNKTNEALMNRVERSTDAAGSSFALFESNLLLQAKLNDHTGKLMEINHALHREILERVKVEDELRKERDFTAAVLDTAGALVVVLDREGSIVRFNRTCEQTTGYTFDEVRHWHLWDLLVPEEVPRVRAVFENLREGRFPSQAENYWVTKSGERRLIAWSNTVLVDDKGFVEHIIGTGIDITERKKAEEKLRLYHRIFMAFNDGIVITDPNGLLVECNPAQEQYVGCEAGPVGQPATAYFHGEDGEAITRCLGEQGSFRGEVRERNRDGSERFIDLSIFPIRNDAGQLIHYVGMGRDITPAKRDQEAIAVRLRYEEGLAGCSQALLQTADPSQVLPEALEHLREAAEAARAYMFENFEDPADGLCAREVYEVCAPGVAPEIDRPDFQHLHYTDDLVPWHKILDEKEPLCGPVRSLPVGVQEILKVGQITSILVLPIWVEKQWYGFIGFDEVRGEREWNKEEIRLLRTAADMIGGFLARRQALRAIRLSEERFRSLVENANGVIYSLAPDGRFTYLSPRFKDFTGFEVLDYLGKPLAHLVHEGDAPAMEEWLSREGLQEDRRVGNEWRWRDRAGTLRWFVSNSSVIRDGEGRIQEIVGVAHDITGMKKLLEDLENANRDLRETQSQLVQSEKMASLGRLVAGVAHEINTPIGSVASMHDTLVKATAKLCELIRAECEEGSEQYTRLQSLLKVIEDANRVINMGTSRVITIVRRLRSFARLDEAELVEADIHEGLEDTLTLVHHEIKHNIVVHRNYGEIPPVHCYMARLNQVFVNLLINAKQAIRGNGEVTITTFRRGERVYIQIADTGVGIPEENLDKIFDPGFTTKGVGIGTGLGLSICYRIIQEHRGEISVESEVGKGTTFTMAIPTNLREILGAS